MLAVRWQTNVSVPLATKKKTASLEVECHFVEEEAQAVVKHGEKQPHTAYLRRNSRCIMDKVWDLVFAWAVWADCQQVAGACHGRGPRGLYIRVVVTQTSDTARNIKGGKECQVALL